MVIFMIGALVAAPDPAPPVPSLPYLDNPSVTYSECVASVSSGQANPRVELIGSRQCRQPRAILLSAIRHHIAASWSSLAGSRAEAARIDAQIDASVRSTMESYEADLQRWLNATAGRR